MEVASWFCNVCPHFDDDFVDTDFNRVCELPFELKAGNIGRAIIDEKLGDGLKWFELLEL